MSLRILRTTSMILFWAAVAGLFLAMVSGAAGKLFFVSTAPALGYIAGFFALLFPSVLEYTARAGRRRRAHTVLSYVDQAVRLHVPLPDFLHAAARSETGRVARRLRETADYLDAGVDLSVALDQAVPELTTREVALVAAAEQTAALRPALSRLASDARPEFAPNEENRPEFAVSYLLLMMTIIAGILFLIFTFVMPKFEAIFRDFHIDMPWVTRQMLVVASAVTPIIATVVAFVFLAWVGRGLWNLVRRPRIPARPDLGPANAFLGYLPLVGSAYRNRAYADVCRVLADGLSAGLPAPTALHHATAVAPIEPVRSKVLAWTQLAHSGTPFADAARSAGLPHVLVGMLASASTTPEAAPVLDFLSRYYAGRFSRTLYLLRGATVPAVVLLMGSLVAFVALALFSPIIALTDQVQHVTGLMK